MKSFIKTLILCFGILLSTFVVKAIDPGTFNYLQVLGDSPVTYAYDNYSTTHPVPNNFMVHIYDVGNVYNGNGTFAYFRATLLANTGYSYFKVLASQPSGYTGEVVMMQNNQYWVRTGYVIRFIKSQGYTWGIGMD